MKNRRIAVCLTIFMVFFIFVPLSEVHAQNYFTYIVKIQDNGSAMWKITYFSGSNDPVDTWENFQTKVYALVDLASNLTHREMGLDQLEINTTIFASSKITEYSFFWLNFSTIQRNQIEFGDVFNVKNFFSQLYGDEQIQIIYPADCIVKSVTPRPYQNDNAAQTIDWARTQDLTESTTKVILTFSPSGETNNISTVWQQYIPIGGLLIGVATLSGVGFFVFRRRKNHSIAIVSQIQVESMRHETEEDKVLNILNLNGGSMRQSDVNEGCKFSKAKTSQLLAVLEKKGEITRYKKGRDKIVVLTERVKEKKS
jgi:LPXTG-motif cell wall-anchored protein